VGAGDKFGADIVVLVTGDCSCISPTLIDEGLEFFFAHSYDLVSNCLVDTYPIGIDLAVVRFNVLAKAHKICSNPPYCYDKNNFEHNCFFIQNHPELFSIYRYPATIRRYHRPDIKLALDTPTDLTLLQRIYSRLYPKNRFFDIDEILDLLNGESSILRLREKLIKVGIVGCGNIAWKWDSLSRDTFNTHAKSYYENPKVHLKACCDSDFERAMEMTKIYSAISPYKDYKEMLRRENLDIVSVCATTGAHYEIMEYILNNTDIKYILCEKPLTDHLELTKKIYLLAELKKANIQVNYMRRWDATLCKLRNILSSENFGDCQLGRIVYYGGIKRNGVHFIDLLHFLGIDFSFKGLLSDIKRFRNDFAASLLLKTNDKKPIYFHWVDEKNYPYLETDIFFQKARIRIDNYDAVEIYKIQDSPMYPDFKELVLVERLNSTIGLAIKNSIDYLIKQFEEKGISYDSLERELKIMKVVSEIERRSKSGMRNINARLGR
jgi:predicted dehydrogenase